MSQAIIGQLTSTFASFEFVRCFANNEAAAYLCRDFPPPR